MERKKLSFGVKIAKDVLNTVGIDPGVEWNFDLVVFDAEVQGEICRRISNLHPAKLGVLVAAGGIVSEYDVRRKLNECEMPNGRRYMEIWAAAVVENAMREIIADNNNRLAVG